jgi:two-component system, NarL family, nitrate/nitrite response regulator NarL
VMRVLVCSPVRLYADGLAAVLRVTEGIEVAGCARNAAGCLRQAGELRPDVVLVDMQLDQAGRLIRALLDDVPSLEVVALAVPEVEGAVVACAEAGVAACVTRDESLEALVSTLSHVVRGESLCSPSTARFLLRRVRTLACRVPDGPDHTRLTSREQDVLRLLEEGLSNKQIAQCLCIELSTVKNHVHSILAKLEVHGRAEAVAAHRRALAGLGSLSP